MPTPQDQASRLTSVTTGGSPVATYTYRGDGLRLAKTVGVATTTFAWDESGGLPLLLAETTGGQQTNYVYGPGGRVIEQIAARPAITPVGTGSASDVGTTSSTVTATFPVAQVGDQIIVAATTNNTASITRPGGYVDVASEATGSAHTSVFRRTAAGGESSVTVSFPNSTGIARIVQVAVYRNVDPADPVDASASATAPGTSAGPVTVNVPSITTTDVGDRLVFVGSALGLNPTTGTWTLPAGMSSRVAPETQPPDYSATIADQTLDTAGPTGAVSATYSVPNTGLIGITLALRAAPTPVLYHHADQLGSTRALTDNDGTVVKTYTYDPYGRLAAQTTAPGRTITNPFGFAGEYTDAETGFQYLRARYYDPATGQFLTRDPLSAVTREPYGYTGNDPINGIDPTGLGEECVKAVRDPDCWHGSPWITVEETTDDPGPWSFSGGVPFYIPYLMKGPGAILTQSRTVTVREHRYVVESLDDGGFNVWCDTITRQFTQDRYNVTGLIGPDETGLSGIEFDDNGDPSLSWSSPGEWDYVEDSARLERLARFTFDEGGRLVAWVT